MSTEKATVKPRITQGKTPPVLLGSREERAYRKAILEQVNGLNAVPREVCTRWRDTILRKIERHAVLTPDEAREFLFVNAQTTAEELAVGLSRKRTAA